MRRGAAVESEDKTSNRVKVFRERGTRNEADGTFDFSQANMPFHSFACSGEYSPNLDGKRPKPQWRLEGRICGLVEARAISSASLPALLPHYELITLLQE